MEGGKLIIKMNGHFIQISSRSISNSRAELLALWALLYFAAAISIPTLHVFGDSSVVIN